MSLYATIFRIASRLDLPFLGELWVYEPLARTMVSRVAPWVLTFSLCLVLYRWVPKAKVAWSAAIWSALAVTIAWRAVTAAFAWYVSSGASGYHLVYGSVSSLIALIFWIYLSSWISLFGAYLSAAIAQRTGKELPPRPPESGA